MTTVSLTQNKHVTRLYTMHVTVTDTVDHSSHLRARTIAGE